MESNWVCSQRFPSSLLLASRRIQKSGNFLFTSLRGSLVLEEQTVKFLKRADSGKLSISASFFFFSQPSFHTLCGTYDFTVSLASLTFHSKLSVKIFLQKSTLCQPERASASPENFTCSTAAIEKCCERWNLRYTKYRCCCTLHYLLRQTIVPYRLKKSRTLLTWLPTHFSLLLELFFYQARESQSDCSRSWDAFSCPPWRCCHWSKSRCRAYTCA